MSSADNKRSGKLCKVCDEEMYESDTKTLKRDYKGLKVTVQYSVASDNPYAAKPDVCHPCQILATMRGTIDE